MYLEQLYFSNFRNLNNITIRPSSGCNLLYGCNGQGKTNVLEAIYLLGNLRSFRNTKVNDCICHGNSTAQIGCTIVSYTSCSTIRLTLEQNGKKLILDDKAVNRASDIHGKINTVVFSPDDTNMVKFGPETRRRYLDRIVYGSSINYLQYWHDYHRILKQRNYLLKLKHNDDLLVWSEKLAESGAHIVFERQRYIEQLNERLQKHYTTISLTSQSVTVSYKPNGLYSETINGLKEELLLQFESNLESDKKYGTTSSGPHRDDIIFLIDNKQIKSFASQGEQKSFVLALKMSEMEHSEILYGEPPILLLDDMTSELDSSRTRNLTDFICERSMQVFITTTDRNRVNQSILDDCSLFHVNEGNLNFEGTVKL